MKKFIYLLAVAPPRRRERRARLACRAAECSHPRKGCAALDLRW